MLRRHLWPPHHPSPLPAKHGESGLHPYILATPNVLGFSGRTCASRQIDRQALSTLRLSRGSIRPSSHSRAVANSAVLSFSMRADHASLHGVELLADRPACRRA